MQILDGRTVYSATDLVGFLECEHLTELERSALAGLVERPVRDDPELAVLQERGQEHERAFLAYLEGQGRTVVDGRLGQEGDSAGDRLSQIQRDAAHTRSLMAAGADVIYQATLFDGTWLGYVDFLQRVNGGSALGPFHYEVLDTKLARRTKGGALLQMCVYSELVAAIQRRWPERIHVALGGSGHRIDSHRLADYTAYFRSVKARFLDAVASGALPVYPLPVVPPPAAHCSVCRWDEHCASLRRAADHLSQVAFMRSDQVKRLAQAGIGTMTDLALLEPPLPDVDGISRPALSGLHAQARLQHASRGRQVPEVELLPFQPNLGLGALPPPSRGDLFFDIEGDPYAEEDGLEYLLGIWDPGDPLPDGTPTFRQWWAHSRQEEKASFESFVDFLVDRWHADPGMHVYHYAAYERARMGMLSTRHATREAEVDRMLRGGLFVDLYKVVRQAMRIGSPSYSIKKLEPLYALDREVSLRDAGSSIVRYEAYARSVSAGRPDPSILDEIAAYNRDDCRSNAELRDWLERQRGALANSLGQDVSRPSADETAIDRPLSERDARIQDLATRLLVTVPVVPEQRLADADAQGRWLLANLLEWHRREEKVEWWAFFDRCSRSDAELVDDDEAIGQLTLVGEIDRPRRSVRYRYTFDPEQPYRLKVGDRPANPATGKEAGRIVAIDALHGTLDLEWAAAKPRPHPSSLIPPSPITADAQKGALERIGEWVAARGIAGAGRFRAGRDFLLRQPPCAGQVPGAPLLADAEDADQAAMRLIRALNESVLPVQGPPGSGKTYTGAEMIVSLVEAGRQVGITAFTHRALTHLLDAVLEHAARRGLRPSAIRKIDSDEEVNDRWAYVATTSNDDVMRALHDGVAIAAGTAWVWARGEFEGIVDTLFVDEAGQLSLANVIAVSGAGRNLVLLGDPQQLSQVKKGAHPEGVDVSSLEFVLDGRAVIQQERGLFLPVTHRLHPDLNRFTSEVFYEGQLHAAPEANRQSLSAPGALTGTGVRWVPVAHAGNRNSSPEEADVVRSLYGDLLAGEWTDEHGRARPVTPAEVLVVAPYNAQVELLEDTLRPLALATGAGLEPKVGTVDKVQGQEAAVVIYSMATSSQDELPRTMEFLYSLNRLNVATSRGRCLSVIVCSPALLRVSVHTPFQMRLANALCRFVEIANGDDPQSRLPEPSGATLAPRSSVSAAELMQ